MSPRKLHTNALPNPPPDTHSINIVKLIHWEWETKGESTHTNINIELTDYFDNGDMFNVLLLEIDCMGNG